MGGLPTLHTKVRLGNPLLEIKTIFLFSPVGEPDLLDLQDLGSDSTVFYQKNLPNLGFPQVGNQLQWRSGLT